MSRRKRSRVPATREPRVNWTRESHRVTGDVIAETNRGLVARRDEGPDDDVYPVIMLVRRDVTNEQAAVELRRLAVELGFRGLRDRLRRRPS